jgi:glycosyltransferase involved in cell wall biosynthesis
MLSKGQGGLEKVFIDYQSHLQDFAASTGGRCTPLIRRGSQTRQSLPPQFGATEISAFSDWDPVTIASARSIVRHHRPSAIVCHGQRAFRIFERASGPDIALIACIHKPRFDVERERTYYVCVADYLADAVRETGIAKDRIFTVHNTVAAPPVSASPFSQAGRAPTILAAGRLHPKKGYDTLLDALSLLEQEGFAFNAVIAGEGDERERLEAQARRLNLAGNVSLPGWVDDMPAFLAKGDIFAFPSRQEGFPLMLLEAMASGLPVVATAIPGVDEMVADGQTGRSIRPDDARQLAGAIRSIAIDPAASIAMAHAGSRHVLASYGQERLGARLMQVLHSVLDQRGKAA